MGPLVSTEWLAAELGKPDLVIFDATKYLPNENKDGKALFLTGHIPGARYFDIDEVADTDTDLPHMVPTPGRFAKLLGALGVGNDSRVVFYDQKGLASAARGWWMMGLFGHDHAAVLDGGLPKWLKEGRAVEAGAPAPAAARSFRPDFRPTRLRGVGDVLANIGTQRELVLDARAAGRFAAGTARGDARRAYSRLRQCAVHRPAEPGPDLRRCRHAARPLRRRRGGWFPPGGNELRHRRDRDDPDFGPASGGPARRGRI